MEATTETLGVCEGGVGLEIRRTSPEDKVVALAGQPQCGKKYRVQQLDGYESAYGKLAGKDGYHSCAGRLSE